MKEKKIKKYIEKLNNSKRPMHNYNLRLILLVLIVVRFAMFLSMLLTKLIK